MARINIIDFAAVPDATSLSTQAIQRAIDSASAGDTVLIPAGRFLTGALFLKSEMTLELAKDAMLLGSQRLEDYPDIPTRVAGIDMVWPAAMLNINHCRNVTVCGSGRLVAYLLGRRREQRDAGGRDPSRPALGGGLRLQAST